MKTYERELELGFEVSAAHDVVFKNTHLEMIKREGSEYIGSVK